MALRHKITGVGGNLPLVVQFRVLCSPILLLAQRWFWFPSSFAFFLLSFLSLFFLIFFSSFLLAFPLSLLLTSTHLLSHFLCFFFFFAFLLVFSFLLSFYFLVSLNRWGLSHAPPCNPARLSSCSLPCGKPVSYHLVPRGHSYPDSRKNFFEKCEISTVSEFDEIELRC